MNFNNAQSYIEATFSRVVFKVSNFLSRIKTWFLFPSPIVGFCHQLILTGSTLRKWIGHLLLPLLENYWKAERKKSGFNVVCF